MLLPPLRPTEMDGAMGPHVSHWPAAFECGHHGVSAAPRPQPPRGANTALQQRHAHTARWLVATCNVSWRRTVATAATDRRSLIAA